MRAKTLAFLTISRTRHGKNGNEEFEAISS